MTRSKAETVKLVLEQFLLDEPKKTHFGNYHIEGDHLVYRSNVCDSAYFDTKRERQRLIKRVRNGEVTLMGRTVEELETWPSRSTYCRVSYMRDDMNVIAQKFHPEGEAPFILGNSSILPLVGRMTYRSSSTTVYNAGVTLIQTAMEQTPGIRMVPFSVFGELKLDINKVRIIDSGGPEVVTRVVQNPNPGGPLTIKETVHFSGPVVFNVDDKYILVDIDRREIEFKNWNAFAVVLPRKVSSVEDAYDSLVPRAVRKAIRDGLDVKRIGEWFLIPSAAPKLRKMTDIEKALCLYHGSIWREEEKILTNAFGEAWLSEAQEKAEKLRMELVKPVDLRAGNNTPNHAEFGVQVGKDFYVKGEITHRGRQHEPLQLDGWHRAVCNTAHSSFQLTGDID